MNTSNNIILYRDVIIGGESGGLPDPTPDDNNLFSDYVYWTKGEVGAYNMAIDAAIDLIVIEREKSGTKDYKSYQVPSIYTELMIKLQSLKHK